jgi:hypothetical protein
METIRALDDVSVSCMEQFLILLEDRFRIEIGRRKIEGATTRLEQLAAWREHIRGQLSVEGGRLVGFQTSAPSGAEERFRSYATAWERIQKDAEGVVGEVAALRRADDEHVVALALKSVDATLEYGKALAKALVAVRRELEQSEGFDAVEYERHVDELSAGVARAWQESVARFKVLAETDDADSRGAQQAALDAPRDGQ